MRLSTRRTLAVAFTTLAAIAAPSAPMARDAYLDQVRAMPRPENEQERIAQCEALRSEVVRQENLPQALPLSPQMGGLARYAAAQRVAVLQARMSEDACDAPYNPAADQPAPAATLDTPEQREDDATCRSYGAAVGSEPYVNCRLRLAEQRRPARPPVAATPSAAPARKNCLRVPTDPDQSQCQPQR